jgi:hypothetical protein
MITVILIETRRNVGNEKVVFGGMNSLPIPCFPYAYLSFLQVYRWHISILHVTVAVAMFCLLQWIDTITPVPERHQISSRGIAKQYFGAAVESTHVPLLIATTEQSCLAQENM